MLRTALFVGVFGLLIPASQLRAQTICDMTNGELHLGLGEECTMPLDASVAPIELSYWTMEDESKVTLPKTATADNTWTIRVEEAAFGYGVMIDARGSSGSKGNHGTNAPSGRPGDCRGGMAGRNGSNGSQGEAGQNVDLRIAFVELGSLTVDVTGGTGGKGGNGGDGQPGGKADVSDDCRGGDGGRAGAAGDGGRGGNGGQITMRLDMSLGVPIPLLERLNFKFSGGEGGEAGQVGEPGKGGPGKCADFGIFEVCKGGGRGGARSSGETGGENGVSGAPHVVLEETFWAEDLSSSSELPSGNKRLQTACGRVFSYFPRFVSFVESYMVDKLVHSYVTSNLEMASKRESAGFHADAKSAYASIFSELELIERAVLDSYWNYEEKLKHAITLKKSIVDLTDVIEGAEQTGCLASTVSGDFNECRSRCLETSRTSRESHDDSGSNQQGIEGERSSSEWRDKGSSEETESITLSRGCVSQCMDTVLEAAKYAACGEVVDSVFELRGSLAKVDATFPTLTLRDVVSTRMRVGEPRSWPGPLVVEHDGSLLSTCTNAVPDSIGIDKCRTYGPSRWRLRYDCSGNEISSLDGR